MHLIHFFLIAVCLGPCAYSVPLDSSAQRPIGAAVDSLKEVPDSLRDTLGLKPGSKKTLRKQPIDTLSHCFEEPHVSFGLGWSIGTCDFFSVWQKGLPDSLQNFTIPARIQLSSFGLSPNDSDSVSLRLSIDEQPSMYTVYFPLRGGFSLIADSLHTITLNGSFLFMNKVFHASVHPDTSKRSISFANSAALFALGVGVTYAKALDQRFFSIAQTSKSYASIGISLSPAYISLNRSITSPDTLAPLFSSYIPGIQAALPDTRAFGIGASLTLGISSIGMVTSRPEALESGIYYSASRFAYFTNNGTRITSTDISLASTNAEPFSFWMHRITFCIDFIRGTKKVLPVTPITSTYKAPVTDRLPINSK